MMIAPIQGKGGSGGTKKPREVAQDGFGGGAKSLPHLDLIQKSFGSHDVSNTKAHVGGAARTASEKLGAAAYTSGDNVAFKSAPDLHTAAHEAAHVVQQRVGVLLPGDLGRVGDQYEKHADAVASEVVSGRSAEGLLNAGPTAGSGGDALSSAQPPLTTSTISSSA